MRCENALISCKFFIIALFLLSLFLFACTPKVERLELPKMNIPSKKKPATEGSIWVNRSKNFLFSDTKAKEVGDIVTVVIEETSQASNSASTETGKNTKISAHTKSLMGFETSLARRNPFFNPSSILDIETKNEFKGEGKTEREGKLKATVSAVVVDVLPNGNLVIEGSKIVSVNGDRQYLLISGIVRPEDISQDNVVSSTKIANAVIKYGGIGIINEQQRPGWLARIIGILWPF